jgi:hypothetical protein
MEIINQIYNPRIFGDYFYPNIIFESIFHQIIIKPMSQYLQITISSFEQDRQEILIAALMESEFEGIEEGETFCLLILKRMILMK